MVRAIWVGLEERAPNLVFTRVRVDLEKIGDPGGGFAVTEAL